MSLDRIVALERSARAALPALHEVAAPGWLCRVSGGTTKRVNAVVPIAPAARLDAVHDLARDLYRRHAMPVRFRLSPLAAAECDTVLDDAGYGQVELSFTMVAPLRRRPIHPTVHIAARADAAWCAGMAAANGWSQEDDLAHRTLLDRLPAGSAVALVDEGDGPLAFGAAALGEGRACLFDIVVTRRARGLGLGRRVVEGLLGWAHDAGHREALLQVLADNYPARALYHSLDFVDAYPYHYRIAP
jgi:GNAT superfamily N-acetyltransferase